jgi:hypothetical protein
LSVQLAKALGLITSVTSTVAEPLAGTWTLLGAICMFTAPLASSAA